MIGQFDGGQDFVNPTRNDILLLIVHTALQADAKSAGAIKAGRKTSKLP